MEQEIIIRLIECKTTRLIHLDKRWFSRPQELESEIKILKKEIKSLEKKLFVFEVDDE